MIDSTSRRSDQRSRIVDVAARLLREQGAAAVTTRGVADHAGVQAPTIYRLFGDKDGLLEAVAEHVMAAYVSSKTAIVEAASAGNIDPVQDLRSGWQTQIEFGLANPTLFRLLSDPDRAGESPAAQSGKRVLATRIRRVALTGRLRVSEQRAANLIHAAGVGAVQSLLSTSTEERDPGLSDDLYEAVLHQILTDPPERPDNTEMATTVAFRAIVPELDLLSEAERELLVEWLNRAIETR